MPELPEVETIKEALKKAIEGSRILSVDIKNGRLRENVPTDFKERIENKVILKVYRRAKYIILELNNDLSVILHLGMSGKIKICDKLPETFEKHDHIVFSTDKGYLIYNDARRFGVVTYGVSAELKNHFLFKHIGIEPFDENLTPSYLFNLLKNKKTSIKIALLDQSIITGIGNIYASEALYEARISPFRLCSDITPEETEELITAIRKTLTKAIKAGGSTLRDYRKPDGSMGYFQNEHCVYDKTGQRCPHCRCDIQQDGGIRRITQGGRSTFYCAFLQK